MRILFYTLFLSLFCSCAMRSSDAAVTTARDTNSQQIVLKPLNDRSLPNMPIIGLAVNQKGGAVLIYKELHFWIDQLDAWPDKYLNKQVKVWGTIESHNDAPVFLDTATVVSQGIPVETEEGMQNQAQRYWITNAKYKVQK